MIDIQIIQLIETCIPTCTHTYIIDERERILLIQFSKETQSTPVQQLMIDSLYASPYATRTRANYKYCPNSLFEKNHQIKMIQHEYTKVFTQVICFVKDTKYPVSNNPFHCMRIIYKQMHLSSSKNVLPISVSSSAPEFFVAGKVSLIDTLEAAANFSFFISSLQAPNHIVLSLTKS